jgi:hypothetical protein
MKVIEKTCNNGAIYAKIIPWIENRKDGSFTRLWQDSTFVAEAATSAKQVARTSVLVRRQRLAHFGIAATKAEWPTVSVASILRSRATAEDGVLLRRVEKRGELHLSLAFQGGAKYIQSGRKSGVIGDHKREDGLPWTLKRVMTLVKW